MKEHFLDNKDNDLPLLARLNKSRWGRAAYVELSFSKNISINKECIIRRLLQFHIFYQFNFRSLKKKKRTYDCRIRLDN